MKSTTTKFSFFKKPEWIASILVVTWAFALSAYSFSWPPVGCTPESCPNGPLAQLLPENIKSGATIVWVAGNVVEEDGLHWPNTECSDGSLWATDCKITTDNKYLSATNHGALNLTPSTSNQTRAAGYIESLTVQGDTDLIAGNIKSWTNLFGVNGTLTTGSPTWRSGAYAWSGTYCSTVCASYWGCVGSSGYGLCLCSCVIWTAGQEDQTRCSNSANCTGNSWEAYNCLCKN